MRAHGPVVTGLASLLTLAAASAVAREKLPVIAALADRCTERCTLRLCSVDGKIQPCPERCGAVGVQVVLPAQQSVIVKFPPQDPRSRRSPRAELLCRFAFLPCSPCQTKSSVGAAEPCRKVCVVQ